MNKFKKIVKNIAGTLMLPAFVYIAMMILCLSHGKTYFGSLMMWRTLIVDIAVSVTCALGIGLQFKNGRFDFSGGAIMLIAAIVAGNIAKNNQNNILLMCGISLLVCVGLSLLVALLYVYGRLPIIIATIGMALLYEATTCLIYSGSGINLVANMQLRKFATFPYAFIPLIGAILVYAIYNYCTVAGKQASLLMNNQQAAVNIGINENKNVIISYLFSGLIFGFATIIYLPKGIHGASFTSLSTVGELFSNILPVFIGLMIAGFCGDLIGIIMGSISLCLLSYAMSAVFSSDMGSAITTIITGIFILLLNVVAGWGSLWIKNMKRILGKEKLLSNSVKEK